MYVIEQFAYEVHPKGGTQYLSAVTFPTWAAASDAADKHCNDLTSSQLPARVQVIRILVNAKTGQPATQSEIRRQHRG